jgi:hypothetical protein
MILLDHDPPFSVFWAIGIVLIYVFVPSDLRLTIPAFLFSDINWKVLMRSLLPYLPLFPISQAGFLFLPDTPLYFQGTRFVAHPYYGNNLACRSALVSSLHPLKPYLVCCALSNLVPSPSHSPPQALVVVSTKQSFLKHILPDIVWKNIWTTG